MRVLIAGVAGQTGRLLAERLLADPAVDGLIGLDSRACYPPVVGMRFVRAAPCQPEWVPLLREVDAAIHLTGVRWPLPWSERRRERALVDEGKFFVRAAAEAVVPRLVVLNSAALYGAQPRGSVSESAPVRGHEASAYARARAQLTDYLDATAYPGVLTRLRAAWVCGPRHLALIQLVTDGLLRACDYADRMLPVVHEDDLIAAIWLALRDDLAGGVYNVSADDGVPVHELAALSGADAPCVPPAWLAVWAWWRWRWKRHRTPPLWIKSLIDSRPLDASKLRAAGWTPRHTARQTLIEGLDIFRAM